MFPGSSSFSSCLLPSASLHCDRCSGKSDSRSVCAGLQVAASRYAEGKPIMSDDEFDTLRRKLKNRNSKVLPIVLSRSSVVNRMCMHDKT